MTLEGLFEPTVIFFGLINSLAIFQTIINKILQNLINTGEVASFINDVIVETEEEKEYDEIIVKVVKRLAENNLYIKPKKCKCKVKEVGFLEVVIRLERIKMKEEKVKGVLDWPTSKECTEVFRTNKLLLVGYKTFYIYKQIIIQLGKERSEVELDREVGENI